MTEKYVIADPHFGHDNIIKYENRPFTGVEEMDWTITNNWNSTVNKRDKIYVLGDFSFYPKEETTTILATLNGYKILILGNHDRRRTLTWWHDVGFNEVIAYPIIYEGHYIFSHEPLYMNSHMPYVNVHGHTHSNQYTNRQYYNVSVECLKYTPINFNEIKGFYDTEGKE